MPDQTIVQRLGVRIVYVRCFYGTRHELRSTHRRTLNLRRPMCIELAVPRLSQLLCNWALLSDAWRLQSYDDKGDHDSAPPPSPALRLVL